MTTAPFTFNHPSGIQISRSLNEADVASLEGVTKRDVKTGYVWYDPPKPESGNEIPIMSLCFRHGVLDSISLATHLRCKRSDWSDWAEDKERLRAKQAEQWLAALGYPIGSYEWGDVWAGYDPQGGCGSAVVRYKSEPVRGGGPSIATSLCR